MKYIQMILMVACLAVLPNCASETSTDAELRRAEYAVEAAEVALSVAEVAYVMQISDPSTSPMAKVAAEQVLAKARVKVAEEKKRLADLREKRAAAAAAAQLAASALLPPPDPGPAAEVTAVK